MSRRRHRTVLFAAFGFLICLLILARVATTHPIDSYAACAQAGNPIADTDPPICHDGGHAFVGPRASPVPAPPAIVTQPFDLLVTGDSGGKYPRREEVIQTQADWQRYWREVHAGLDSIPPLIPVDFTTSTVVALSEGQQPTSGFSFRVASITQGSAGSTVDVTESTPTITCVVAQAITNRYRIVRTAKLTEPVVIRVTTEKRHC